MSQVGLSDKIRQRALDKYVEPAFRTGSERFSIHIKELMQDMEKEGFPPNHPAQFCTALRKRAFLQEHGLELEGVDGPPSGKSTTVVLHLRIARPFAQTVKGTSMEPTQNTAVGGETPEERAERVVRGLEGLLKDEIGAYGGTEAFMRWVRSDGDEAA